MKSNTGKHRQEKRQSNGVRQAEGRKTRQGEKGTANSR